MNEKIYLDKQKFIEGRLKEVEKNLIDNLDNLPNEELPFMENHLRAFYFEIYYLLAERFYNASLILMGIFLEIMIKEKLFLDGVKDDELEGMDFGKAIIRCKSVLTQDEIVFLSDKKNKLRNQYVHSNKMKISKDIYFPGWKIPIEKLLELAGKVKAGEITEEQFRTKLIEGIPVEPISSGELRPVSQIAKSEFEKENAIPIFLEIDKFVREFSERYFKPK